MSPLTLVALSGIAVAQRAHHAAHGGTGVRLAAAAREIIATESAFTAPASVDIPSAGGDLPVAAWQHRDRSGLSKSAKKRTAASELTEDDNRLSKRQMRSEQGGHAHEKDWTTEALRHNQITSSRGYPMELLSSLKMNR